MITVESEKQWLEKFINSIANGDTIACPEGGWTTHAVLALAGVLHFSAFSHGPQFHKDADLANTQNEKAEFIEEQFYDDLRIAIEFYSHLTMMVKNGQYDAAFEASVKAVLKSVDGNGSIHSINGKRD